MSITSTTSNPNSSIENIYKYEPTKILNHLTPISTGIIGAGLGAAFNHIRGGNPLVGASIVPLSYALNKGINFGVSKLNDQINKEHDLIKTLSNALGHHIPSITFCISMYGVKSTIEALGYQVSQSSLIISAITTAALMLYFKDGKFNPYQK